MTTPTPDHCPRCGHDDAHVHSVGCLRLTGPSAYCDCPDTWESKAARKARDTAETEHALNLIQGNTSVVWEAAAEDAIQHLAQAGPEFTPDDVWDRLADTGAPNPHDPRALGPIMKRAIRDGVIRPRGFASSRRRHGSPVRLYVGGGSK